MIYYHFVVIVRIWLILNLLALYTLFHFWNMSSNLIIKVVRYQLKKSTHSRNSRGSIRATVFFIFVVEVIGNLSNLSNFICKAPIVL